jgi:hypothetical protein
MSKKDDLEDAIGYLSARDRELLDAAKLTAAVREGRAPYRALEEAERAILEALNEQRGAAGILRKVRRAYGEP